MTARISTPPGNILGRGAGCKANGVRSMKLSSQQQLSVLACSTGLVLAAICALAFFNGAHTFEHWAMLLAAICGFELYLFGQDMRLKLRKRRG